MAKILESLNHPDLVNFKNVCYQQLTIMIEYVSFSFSPFGAIREICVDWMSFQCFLIIFQLK